LSDQQMPNSHSPNGVHGTTRRHVKRVMDSRISPIDPNAKVALSIQVTPAPTKSGYGSSQSSWYFRGATQGRTFYGMANPRGKDLNHG